MARDTTFESTNDDTLAAVSPRTKRRRRVLDEKDVYARAVQSEWRRYANHHNHHETTSQETSSSSYRPGTTTLTKTQLRAAALEFRRRSCEKGEDLVGGLLVARNLITTPSRPFERKALAGTGIDKLWYALTKEHDLLLLKISLVGDAHSISVVRLIGDLGTFSDPYDGIFYVSSNGNHCLLSGTTVAPDCFLQRRHPEQPPAADGHTNPQLVAPFVIELEIGGGNNGPKALLEQLRVYLQQPGSDYALGIKVYPRTGPPVAGGKRRRPFAAIASLWRRRGMNPPAALVGQQQQQQQQVQLVGIWSFGTGALDPKSRREFATACGSLAPIPDGMMIVHPAPSLDIIIPGADLIQGAVDVDGNSVPLLPEGKDLIVRLGPIQDICESRLPW